MIDVLHVPYTYFPDRTGGTETYVAALARGLRAHGLATAIAAPSEGEGSREYEHEGSPVVRFATAGARLSLRDQYGAGDPVAADAFAGVIARLRPRIVHIHAWTSGISLRLVRVARAAGLPVVFTYHTPAVSCARGSLMIYGESVCDGALFVDRCSRCVLEQHGVPLPIGWMLGKIPTGAGAILGDLRLQGAPWLALRMTELMNERHTAFRRLLDEADAIVAVQDWVRDLLLFLGAPREKVTLSRLALPTVSSAAVADRPTTERRPRLPDDTVRLVFFGRLEQLKGVHVVVEALIAMPTLPVSLDIYGAPQGVEGARYLESLKHAARTDARIRFLPPVAAERVVEQMRDYDALVVPSIVLETGPLVVLEAMSAGLPVLGSALGGIMSSISHGIDGLLVPAADERAWGHAIRRLADEPGLLELLTSGVRPPETMERVVAEMLTVYSFLGQRAGQSAHS